ncbi:MAG: S9 family peptidase [Gammaproteobacteria bacterium]|nr:S9 family peptidase [Gammaproteobacteria bacterium]
MQKHIVLFGIGLAICACSDNNQVANDDSLAGNASNNSGTTMVNNTVQKVQPPVAKKIPHKLVQHGNTRIDNYYWMRDDSRKSPEVIEHLQRENEFAAQQLEPMEDLKNKILAEINGRIEKDDSSVPYLDRGYYYYSQFKGDQEYPVYARRKGSLSAPEEILLDGNQMAAEHEYFNIGDLEVSQNNQLLAFSTDTLSRRVYTIQFKDLQSGKLLNDSIKETNGQVIWANDNKNLFYIRKDPQTLLGYQVYRHTLGTPQESDTLVYEENDLTYYTSLGKTKDDSIIYIYHDSTTTRGASIVDANNPEASFVPFTELEDNHEYEFDKIGEYFYILTNWQAKNYRIMKVHQSNHADRSKWQTVVEHNDDIFLTDFELLKDFLVIEQKQRGVSEINIRKYDNAETESLQFDDPIFVAGFSNNVSLGSNTLRLYYSSMTTPTTIFDINLDSGKRETLKQQKVLDNDFHPSNYESKRIFVKARDGVEVPVSLVYRKNTFKQDGKNPLYVYAYGSYGITIEPSFSASLLSLLDRGFVYAIAHIRGGQMLGVPWYDGGKLKNKRNSFTDFIDVTNNLLELKYGSKEKVFAAGGSAGGLLMGGVINMAPELYTGVAAHVPFVDVVTTMSDPSIPLTTNEYDEWGNPANKDDYEYILSYSPYDQVSKQDYPNLLVTTGLHDSQVQYFEPMKWVAKLREYKSNDNLLIFKTDMEAGHGGASGRFKQNETKALEYAFFAYLAGKTE